MLCVFAKTKLKFICMRNEILHNINKEQKSVQA